MKAEEHKAKDENLFVGGGEIGALLRSPSTLLKVMTLGSIKSVILSLCFVMVTALIMPL